MAEIIHKDLSYTVNGCIFDVHNKVGPGVREEPYQKAMEICLAAAGLPFLAKPRTRRELIHRGEVADIFEPDLVVAERLIVELKAQREGLNRANFMQTVNYVKFWNLSLGLLTNFAEALHEQITARAIRTMQSHLKFTGVRIGIVVNFGKDRFEIRGVRPLKK